MGLSGYALAKNSTNPNAAIALMKWLSGQEGQTRMTNTSNEFPVNPEVSQSRAAAMLGTFKQDTHSLDQLVDDLPVARELIEEVGLHL